MSAHSGSGATLLGHCLGAGSLGFGNQALNRYLRVDGGFGGDLLMNSKLFNLNFLDSF
jgi:hypothetical protein